MTEMEWVTCDHLRSMAEFIRGRVSERKWWLFAAACLREGPWSRLPECWRACAEVAERHADGRATAAEVQEAWRKALEWDVEWDVWRIALETARASLALTRGEQAWTPANFRAGEAAQCDLLRDIVGNPFCYSPVDSLWLTWNGGIVPALAQSAYDDRQFNALPVLADALEDAGCVNADWLAHCRRSGPHVRGCWVVDQLLGKK